jgi:hypothetical protein
MAKTGYEMGLDLKGSGELGPYAGAFQRRNTRQVLPELRVFSGRKSSQWGG